MADLIGQRLGQYEIVALLGKGGMATVYRAREVKIERDVALKVIRSDLVDNPDFVRRIKRKTETLASLSVGPKQPYVSWGQHPEHSLRFGQEPTSLWAQNSRNTRGHEQLLCRLWYRSPPPAANSLKPS
jgi:serine/threonine protein kinase